MTTNLIAYPAWALLIAGGVMSAFAVSPGWERAAAYMIALALLYFAGSTVLKILRPANG